MKVSGVIFDMDGVVFDSESLWREGYKVANEACGVELSEEFRQSICGKSEIAIREEIHMLLPSLDVNAYRARTIEYVSDRIDRGDFDVKDGFMECVTYLRSKGYKIALATSSHRDRAERMFERKGLDMSTLFDACSFLEDVGANSKPNPYIFKITADKMGVAYGECVVLEDSINGIHAAVNGGMIPIHVRDIIAPNDFVREHSYALLSSLREVEEHI